MVENESWKWENSKNKIMTDSKLNGDNIDHVETRILENLEIITGFIFIKHRTSNELYGSISTVNAQIPRIINAAISERVLPHIQKAVNDDQMEGIAVL